ncbi:MAG: 30S ribosomal subunit protein S5 [uncultured bacterium]|nr:MAG: 30S ribosomal subunit protein S5 [uncultured bacterium]KKT02472.1 MAG: 30S ribosomal protein S5, small subunit ribosomal protein S5 [Candidatus Peregrinibacteria bacterium GW2011_GWF2_43_17]KKT19298.1 MAG: ribosomal protein S5, nonfunctional [Candidatus Peregrinibacteria bacterium GW2011_GWA2_43_8]HAU40194.1 30S ribosomal protein S5 [Candidatus Peregrinibacteria bacterium]
MSKKPFNKGRGPQEPKEFEEEVIEIDRVTRVVKGGRRMRFRATVVIGNKKGKVGMGIGKATEVQAAIKKAVSKAKKNMKKINLFRDSIPHKVQAKFKSAKILLIPAGKGTGIIAGGATRKVAELVGIKNILSKSFGSSNKINCVKATFKALLNLREKQDVSTAPKQPIPPAPTTKKTPQEDKK